MLSLTVSWDVWLVVSFLSSTIHILPLLQSQHLLLFLPEIFPLCLGRDKLSSLNSPTLSLCLDGRRCITAPYSAVTTSSYRINPIPSQGLSWVVNNTRSGLTKASFLGLEEATSMFLDHYHVWIWWRTEAEKGSRSQMYWSQLLPQAADDTVSPNLTSPSLNKTRGGHLCLSHCFTCYLFSLSQDLHSPGWVGTLWDSNWACQPQCVMGRGPGGRQALGSPLWNLLINGGGNLNRPSDTRSSLEKWEHNNFLVPLCRQNSIPMESAQAGVWYVIFQKMYIFDPLTRAPNLVWTTWVCSSPQGWSAQS